MPLLDRYEHPCHRPEYSTLVVRGTPWTTDLPPELAHLNLDLLDEDAFAGWPQGDLGGAGNGWVLATATALNHVVLEAHDSAPPPSDEQWGNVMESPLLSGGLGVNLTQVIQSEPMRGVRLGPPGLYRVRMHRRRLDDRREWLLQFWPADGVLEPPRRLSRGPRSAQDGDLDSDLAMDLVAIALWSPGQATKADLAERLLASIEEIDAALAYALRHELLHVDGRAASTVSLTPVDKRPPEVRDPFAAARKRSAAIKAWAKANGVKINQRGNIPPEVEEQFRRHQGPLT
ncbi:Lsr2 family DNA-binding protein [Actinomadura montaniterrae]|nr:histone-like nucleoid-structuring protein Lsr2 [Actinomadura montaniterrae]